MQDVTPIVARVVPDVEDLPQGRPDDAPARPDPTPAAPPDGPGLAVIGTPRSGNTWLRRLVATGYAIGGPGNSGREFAVHDPGSIDWAGETWPFIVQVHVLRDEATARAIADAGVRVLVPTRHPYDVLISILQYATHASNESARWLGGEGGDEETIRGLDPCHPAFLDYATGPRSAALLAISSSWSVDPAAISLRYEDLVADPEAMLYRVGRDLGRRPVAGNWRGAVRANSLETMRKGHGKGHVWRGQPGLWRSLLTPEAVDRLARAEAPELRACRDRADPDLTPGRALACWRDLA